MMTMNIKEFTKHIERMQEAVADTYSLSDLLKTDTIDFGSDLISSIIELLEIHFNDESEWISYWMWELDFGSKYREGTVTSNNENVPLKSIEDLYKLLMDNIKSRRV